MQHRPGRERLTDAHRSELLVSTPFSLLMFELASTTPECLNRNGNLRTCQMRRQLAEGVEGSGPALSGPGSHAFAVSWSHDGGATWSAIAHQPQLVTPVCQVRIARCLWPAVFRRKPVAQRGWLGVVQASIISYKGPQDSAPALYFSSPYSTTHRQNGTILGARCGLRLSLPRPLTTPLRQLLTTERSSPAL